MCDQGYSTQIQEKTRENKNGRPGIATNSLVPCLVPKLQSVKLVPKQSLLVIVETAERDTIAQTAVVPLFASII